MLVTDVLFGRIETVEKATKIINAVAPLLYVFGGALVLASFISKDITIPGPFSGLFIMFTTLFSHWKKSRIGAFALFIYVLFLTSILFSAGLDPAELFLLAVIVVAAFLALRGVLAYQRLDG